jgi:prepilin-type N-terminal cleavage/methylation domain-containing protein
MPFPRSSRIAARSRRGGAGFTLVEVMVAIAIGTIVLMMMGAVYVIVQGTFAVSSKKVTAQQEATLLSTYINREIRVGNMFFVYEVPNHTVPADSGDGIAIFDEDGLPLQRIEYDAGLQTVVDSTGSPVTAMRVHNFQFAVIPLSPREVRYRFATDDEHGNLVDMESAVSLRN